VSISDHSGVKNPLGVALWLLFIPRIMNENSKPTLATGMARRSFWIAVGGGASSFTLRLPGIDGRLQALLACVAVIWLLIAMVFGLIALIRITHADRNAVLLPALGGLLLGLSLNLNLAYWTRDQWLQTRLRVAARQNSQRPAPAPVNPKSPASAVIKYDLPALEEIPASVLKLRSKAAKATDDDAAVLRAWAGHLEHLNLVYTNTFAASNKLHEIDLLDPKLITDFKDDEAIRRRRLANDYSTAWHELDSALTTFPGSFSQALSKERVSPDRFNAEFEAILAFVKRPEVESRINSFRKLCQAEEAVGQHYNYAVSAVFSFAQLTSKAPNLPPQFRDQMDRSLAKLHEVQQTAADSRQKIFASVNQVP